MAEMLPDGLVWGEVLWFDDVKGYGFVRTVDGDVFVHYKQIRQSGRRTLVEHEIIAYSFGRGLKGLRADVVYRRAELEAAGIEVPGALTKGQAGSPVVLPD